MMQKEEDVIVALVAQSLLVQRVDVGGGHVGGGGNRRASGHVGGAAVGVQFFEGRREVQRVEDGGAVME